jgi:hypothetical protein
MTDLPERSVYEQAYGLYVKEHLTLTEIAELMPQVPLSKLKTWSSRNGWVRRQQRRQRREAELEDLLFRLKLALAKMVMPEDDQPPEFNAQMINCLCRVVSVLSPPASVALKKWEKEEAEAEGQSVEERMARVIELLEGAGFDPGGDA